MRHTEDIAGSDLPFQARLALGLSLKMEGQVGSPYYSNVLLALLPPKAYPVEGCKMCLHRYLKQFETVCKVPCAF